MVTDERPLACAVKVEYDDRLVVGGSARFNSVTAATKLGVAFIEKLNQVNVDMGGLTELDSSALAMLLEWQRVALSAQKKIHFYNAPKSLVDLGRVYGLDAILNFEHSNPRKT